MPGYFDRFLSALNEPSEDQKGFRPLQLYKGKDLSEKKEDGSVMDEPPKLKPSTYEEREQEQAFKGAGLPTIGVGDLQFGISDFVTPGGLAKLVAAPAAMLTGAIAIGSKIAGPVSSVARKLPGQVGALLPEPYYHGTTKAFKDYEDGLIFLTPNANNAENYALGGGGNRGRKRAALLHDGDTGDVYNILKETTDSGYQVIQKAGDSKAPKLGYDSYDKIFRPLGAPDKPSYPYSGESYLLKEYEAWVAKYPEVYAESASIIPEGANIRRTAVDINKSLNLKAPYRKQEDSESYKILASLDHKGSGIAQNIINNAKRGDFDWSSTKYSQHQKVWKDILIPQLEARGYDSVRYWDDGHETLAVFSNKNLKDVSRIKDASLEQEYLNENYKRLSEIYK